MTELTTNQKGAIAEAAVAKAAAELGVPCSSVSIHLGTTRAA
jgi:hypothetical protein